MRCSPYGRPCPAAVTGPASMHAGLAASPIPSNGAQAAQPPHGLGAPLPKPTSSGMRRRALSSLRHILATAAPQRPRSVCRLPAAGTAATAAAVAAWARSACLLTSWHLGCFAWRLCLCNEHICTCWPLGTDEFVSRAAASPITARSAAQPRRWRPSSPAAAAAALASAWLRGGPSSADATRSMMSCSGRCWRALLRSGWP